MTTEETMQKLIDMYLRGMLNAYRELQRDGPSNELTFDEKFMVFRLLSSVPNSVFQTLLYLRLRRVVPFALAHALMDGATVLIPLLRA